MFDFPPPGGLFVNPSPLRFFSPSFFQLCFLDAAGVNAVAKVVVEPAKNIRPVMSAMISMKVLGIIVLFRQLASGGGQPGRGSHKLYFLLFIFL
jgi:hypothetical protein